jgi:hypothetical protein
MFAITLQRYLVGILLGLSAILIEDYGLIPQFPRAILGIVLLNKT